MTFPIYLPNLPSYTALSQDLTNFLVKLSHLEIYNLTTNSKDRQFQIQNCDIARLITRYINLHSSHK